MKILLANPPWYYFDKHGKKRIGVRSGSRWPFTIYYGNDIGYRPFPFFLAYTQSLLVKNKIESYFLDSITANHTYDQFYSIINKKNPEFVLIETSAPSWENDKIIINNLYKQDRKVILTGPYATAFSKKLIKNKSIFAVFEGEYEYSILNFLNFKHEVGVYKSSPFNINELPFPYRDNNIIWNYKEKTHGSFGHKQISVLGSRGCPFRCSYCLWVNSFYKMGVNYRSIENIINEIKYLKNIYGEEIIIYFDDDAANLNSERTIELAERIFKETQLNWTMMARADILTIDEWEYIYNLGCKAVNVGVESGSKKILNSMGKKLNLEKVEKNIKHMQEIGMHVHTTWMFGYEGETKEDIKKTINLYNKLKTESSQISYATPMPGTPWYKSLKKRNMLSMYDSLDGYKSREQKFFNIRHRLMPPKSLSTIQKMALSQKKRQKTKKEKENMSIGQKNQSALCKKEKSRRMKNLWKNEEYRNIMKIAKQKAYKNNIGNIRENTIKAQIAAIEKTKNTKIEIFVKSLLEINNIQFLQQIKISKYWYDFAINKKIIEVDGDYWHANPKVYDKNHLFHFPGNKTMFAFQIWKRDNIKNKIAIKNGFKTLRIWEKDIKENPDNVNTKILTFLEVI